jgi:6-phosphogluconolactonase
MKLLSILVLTLSTMSAQNWIAYVGTYTQGFSRGIYSLSYDPATGSLTPIALAAQTVSPSFLAAHPNGRILVAVNESRRYNGIANSGSVSSFSIDPATGDLTLINAVPTRGADPCHVTFDRTGRWLFVANYGGGNIAVFPVAENGTLSEATQIIQHEGSSANPVRQEAAHVHSVDVSPDNRYLYVSDLGKDQILVYNLDAATGRLTLHSTTNLKPGTGPRHLAFSRDRRYLYSLGEIAATVTTFRHDDATAALEELQSITTLPHGYIGEKSAAEIAVDPSGRFLYASNRAHNSIAAFSIDAEQGRLMLIGHVATQGRTPRHFTIDPDGSHLIVANQDTDTLTVFNIHPETGALLLASEPLGVPRPVCLLLVSQVP